MGNDRPLYGSSTEAVTEGSSQPPSETIYDRLNEPSDDQSHVVTDEASMIKAKAIAVACDEYDIAAVIEQATSAGGLLTDGLRRRAWTILLGCPGTSGRLEGPKEHIPDGSATDDWRYLPKHKDEDQVRPDVNRSFVYYPQGATEPELEVRKVELSDVIIKTLRTYPMLCYFQGFHDIVQVLLLVLGVDIASDAVPYVSILRIRDFMLPSLSPSLDHLQLLPAILKSVDQHLYAHVSKTKPFFALAATLTLYAHEIQEYGDIARLFDFFLAQEAAIPVYFFAVIMLSRKKELHDIPEDEPEMLHFTLSKLPQPLDLEALIQQTVQLFETLPPEQLLSRAWRKVPSYSVLKTTRRNTDPSKHSNTTTFPSDLAIGVAFFQRQVTQLRYEEFRRKIASYTWRHRRALGGFGVTVLVGVLSLWVQRRSLDNPYTVSEWLKNRLGF